MENNLEINQKALTLIVALNMAKQKSRNGISFLSVKNYENSKGEIANHLLNVGIKYENAVKADVAFLQKLDIQNHVFTSTPELIETARLELIESFLKPNENRSNGQINAYTHIGNGIKVENNTGFLHVYGYREKKDVIINGNYPTVNSKPLTIAKNELRKLLRTGKFVNFILKSNVQINVNKQTITL